MDIDAKNSSLFELIFFNVKTSLEIFARSE